MEFTKPLTYESFVSLVADDVFGKWNDNDKLFAKEHQNPSEYHFTLGLAIRNAYVYPYLEQYDFVDVGDVHPDSVSVSVISRLLKMVTSL